MLTGKVLRFDDVLTCQIEVQVQVIDAFTGQVHLSEVVRVNKTDSGTGPTRAQLLERSAERAAACRRDSTRTDAETMMNYRTAFDLAEQPPFSTAWALLSAV
ncbi:MAG: hypothetical protein IPO05_17925 [Flavobacteriales bacterium]|nr:hypothetical protein [Flavobacteriales bacterium]